MHGLGDCIQSRTEVALIRFSPEKGSQLPTTETTKGERDATGFCPEGYSQLETTAYTKGPRAFLENGGNSISPYNHERSLEKTTPSDR